LRKFNFSESFVNIVKMLYTDLTADVMVNGLRYGRFKILRGVKQGDSLSCILFILCMEILLLNIKNNENIKGLRINDEEIKTFIYADDTSPGVKNRESIQHVFNEYINFSNYSGIELNHGKTEILPIGKIKHNRTPINLICRSNNISIEPVKILKIGGIWFGHDTQEVYAKNVNDKIAKLRKILDSWSFAKFTLSGNIIIAKTFGLSQFVRSQNYSIWD